MSDPQNPYRSSVVKASAGSGKTYQLSRRFVFLVGAGASPASILTVTFTKKAAAEMRARILQVAADLLGKASEQEAFDMKLQSFWREARTLRPDLPRPRSAYQTAAAILAATQSLRISTIDALLLDWLRKFPYEASGNGTLRIPPRFDLLSGGAEDKLHRRAWFRCLKELMQSGHRKAMDDLTRAHGLSFLDLENQVRKLARYDSFLWLLKEQRPHLPPLLLHPVDSAWLRSGPGDLIAHMEEPLRRVCEMLKDDRRALVGRAIADRDFQALLQMRILTKEGRIHGNTFRAPKRDAYASEISAITDSSAQYFSTQARLRLNEISAFLGQVFEGYQTELGEAKLDERALSFTDLIKGGYYLFSDPHAAGARYLLNRTIRHLLLDEFQDTSVLQWTVFRTMAEEMLAGEGFRSPDELDPTLFVVGDAKQSIYGFRDADAEILGTAARFLLERKAQDVELSASFRTHPLLLRYINQVMEAQLDDFPEHVPALLPDAQETLVQGPASLTIAPLLIGDEDGASGFEKEARFVADYLWEQLQGRDVPQIWDKERKAWRSLKPGDCVILYRASTHARTYADALRLKGLSVRIEEGQSFFSRPEISDLLALCQLMAYPNDLQAASQVLKSPLLGVADVRLLEALQAFHRLAKADEQLTSIDAVNFLFEELKDDLAPLKEYFDYRHDRRPYEIVHSFALQEGTLQRYADAFGEDEGLLAAANIQKFMELLLQADGASQLSWMQILRFLRDKEKEKGISLASVSEDAVQMMTIHKSKGLEFPLVVLIDTGEDWEKSDPYWAKCKDGDLGTGVTYVGRRSDIPRDDPYFSVLHQDLTDEARKENFRLLYVALTRAQYHLLVTGNERKTRDEDDHESFHQILSKGFSSFLAQSTVIGGLSCQQIKEVPSRPLQEALSLSPTAERPKVDALASLHSWSYGGKADPAGVQILAPARLLADDSVAGGSGSGHFAFPTEAGLYIHKALEMSIKGEAFDGPQYWQSLSPGPKNPQFQVAYAQIARETAEILQSESWIRLASMGLAYEAELPIAFLDGSSLVRGFIDLLLKKDEQTWLVVDYKTTWEAHASEDLLAFSLRKRYDRQMALYVEAVRRLYPHAIVEGSIFFTAQRKLVPLQRVSQTLGRKAESGSRRDLEHF